LESVAFSPEARGTTVGVAAFEGCRSMKTLALPSGPTTFDRRALACCQMLRSLVFPAGGATVGEEAFEGCVSLERVAFADGLTKLVYRAFGACELLETVEVPASLTSFDETAFYDCSYKLRLIAPDGSFAAKFAEKNKMRGAAPKK
jgi:hypothetical protein